MPTRTVTGERDEPSRQRTKPQAALPDAGFVVPGDAVELQQAVAEPGRLKAADIPAVQQAFGNRAAMRLLARTPTRPSMVASPDRIQRVGTVISAPALAGTSSHPTLRRGDPGNNKDAVKELQRKLRSALGIRRTSLVADGVFGSTTERYVKRFQRENNIAPANGVVEKPTWDQLDAQGKSKVGRVEREWEETEVGGETYALTSKFTWRIDSRKILITVGINFVADATHPPPDMETAKTRLITPILTRWNRFKAKQVGPRAGPVRDIVFRIVDGTDVQVTLVNGPGRSDAGTWYLHDPDMYVNAGAHEFGHLIGLEDEYQRTEEDYTRLHAGTAPPAGQAVPEGFDAEAVAKSLNYHLKRSTVAHRGRNTHRHIIQKYNLTQGRKAQAIKTAYEAKYGTNLVDDINAGIGAAGDGADYLWDIVDPFTFTNQGSLMGMGAGANVDCNPEPRHVREFVKYVQDFYGGVWEAE
jgi:hypothetical protein